MRILVLLLLIGIGLWPLVIKVILSLALIMVLIIWCSWLKEEIDELRFQKSLERTDRKIAEFHKKHGITD